MNYQIGFVLPVEPYKFKQQPQVLEGIYAIPMQMSYRNMRYFTNGFGIGNKLIYRCHDNHLVPFMDEFPDDILPEIVNIPGGIGYNDDSLWVHFFSKENIMSMVS